MNPSEAPAGPAAKQQQARKTCFVVMPMSDVDGYTTGHWDRVYRELFQPACEKAGFVPKRADSNKGTALIMADVLRELHRADMVLCDLSSLRPNVMFELGLRQAFDQPVVLAYDQVTPRPFDIAQLRDVRYDSSLRIDMVRDSIDTFASALRETYEKRETGEFSLVRLLEIGAARTPNPPSGDAVQRSILTALERLTDEVVSIRLNNLSVSTTPVYGVVNTGTGMTGGTGGTVAYFPAQRGLLYSENLEDFIKATKGAAEKK